MNILISNKFFNNIFIIRDSFSLLFKNPVLFLPKLIIAVLFGFGILLGVDLAKGMLTLYSLPANQVALSTAQNWLFSAIVLLVLSVFTFFVDLFFSALYPVLVEDAKKRKLSFISAIRQVKSKLIKIFVSGVILLILMLVSSILASIFIMVFNLSSIGVVISFLISFMFAFCFYFLYPVIVFEKIGLFAVFKKSFLTSVVNKKRVFFYSLIPFSVSLIKYFVAFFANSDSMFLLFWFLVALTGVVYTIHAVVNQLAYSKIN